MIIGWRRYDGGVTANGVNITRWRAPLLRFARNAKREDFGVSTIFYLVKPRAVKPHQEHPYTVKQVIENSQDDGY